MFEGPDCVFLREPCRAGHNILHIDLLTGATNLIDEDDWKDSGSSELDVAALTAAFTGDFQLSADALLRFSELFRAACLRQIRVEFLLILTYDCNARCAYCWQRNAAFPRPSETMSEAMVERVFEMLPECLAMMNSTLNPTIGIFGGEPIRDEPALMRSVLLVLRLAGSRKIPVQITTNGLELHRHIDEFLECGFDGAQVTLDGPARIHNRRRRSSESSAFAETIKSIDALLRYNKRVAVRINVDVENVEYLPELARYFIDKGWVFHRSFKAAIALTHDHSRTPNPLYESNARELLRKLFMMRRDTPETLCLSFENLPATDILDRIARGEETLPRFNNCPAETGLQLLFDPTGLLYCCHEAAGDRSLSIGSFYPAFSLDKAALARWQSRNVLVNRGCRDCAVRFVCGGGCALEAFNRCGEFAAGACPPVRPALEEGARHFWEQIIRTAKTE